MENTKNYIQWIRSKVGHDKIMLIFAGGCIFNEKGEVLLQRRFRAKGFFHWMICQLCFENNTKNFYAI